MCTSSFHLFYNVFQNEPTEKAECFPLLYNVQDALETLSHPVKHQMRLKGSSARLKTDLVVVDVTVASDDDAFLNPRLWQATL